MCTLQPRCDSLVLRKIKACFVNLEADVAVGQMDNFMEDNPAPPLKNEIIRLSVNSIAIGAKLFHYSYPLNSILDFKSLYANRHITGAYYEGRLNAIIDDAELSRRNAMKEYSSRLLSKTPYWVVDMSMESGASGGPVFDDSGSVVAINSTCMGASPPNFVIPVRHLFELEVNMNDISCPKIVGLLDREMEP